MRITLGPMLAFGIWTSGLLTGRAVASYYADESVWGIHVALAVILLAGSLLQAKFVQS